MMVPLEELYEVLSKSRDLLDAENNKTSCVFCVRRSNYDWHDDECPVRKLYVSVKTYDDAKDRMTPNRSLVG